MVSLADVLNGPPVAEFTLNGQRLSDNEILQMEARAQRRALTLIKSRLHPDRLEELVSPEIEESDRRFRSWAESSAGEWRPAVVEAHVSGLTSEQFTGWMFGKSPKPVGWADFTPLGGPAANTDRAEWSLGHPEHYRLSFTPDPKVLREVETIGGIPVCWKLCFGEISDPGPEIADWPKSAQGGIIRLRDGTPAALAGHRWVNTEDGLRVRLAIYFRDTAPEEVIRGMQEHLAVEFNLWLTYAKIAHGALDGDVNDYIAGGAGIDFLVNGQEIDHMTVLRWEVAAMRRALNLIHARLSSDQMEDLCGPETAEMDRRFLTYASQSDGRLRPSALGIKFKGMKGDAFFQWLLFNHEKKVDDWATHLPLDKGPVACNASPSWLLGHPEHYRMTEDGQDVRQVETIDGLPLRWTIKFAGPQPTELEPDPDFPIAAPPASVVLRDGTEVARACHRFRDTDEGFEGILDIQFSEAVPDSVIRIHQEHMAVEFKNWTGMAAWELGLPGLKE